MAGEFDLRIGKGQFGSFAKPAAGRRSSVAGPIDTLRGPARLYVDPPAHAIELYSSRQPLPT